jgi:hypothetical protein
MKMTDLKDMFYGVLSGVALAGQLAWEWFVKWWGLRSSTQQSVMLAVAIVLAAMLSWNVAHAENAPHSNFGVVNSLNKPGVAFACYLADSRGDMSPGTVHTCLILQAVPPGVLATFGQVTFCTMTGTVQDKPQWSCGKYEDMYKLSMGV